MNKKKILIIILILILLAVLTAVAIIFLNKNKDKNESNTDDWRVKKGYEIYGYEKCGGHDQLEIAGQAFTPWECKICGYKGSHNTTAIPKLCNDCAEATGRCAKCGKLENDDEKQKSTTPKKSKKTSKTQKTYEELIQGVNIDKVSVKDSSNITTEENRTFFNNVILIYFKDECSDETKAQVINSVDGKVFGGNKFLNMLQIEVKESIYEELKQMCKDIEANEGVSAALIDELSTTN